MSIHPTQLPLKTLNYSYDTLASNSFSQQFFSSFRRYYCRDDTWRRCCKVSRTGEYNPRKQPILVGDSNHDHRWIWRLLSRNSRRKVCSGSHHVCRNISSFTFNCDDIIHICRKKKFGRVKDWKN